jgi:hypothetical protein
MRDMWSVARSMRLRAEEGATADELEVELGRSDLGSGVEGVALEVYAWALVRVAGRAAQRGEKDDRRP